MNYTSLLFNCGYIRDNTLHDHSNPELNYGNWRASEEKETLLGVLNRKLW